MDLNQLLQKTRPISSKIKVTRPPPGIATADRPYTIDEIIIDNNSKTKLVAPKVNRGQIEDKIGTESRTELRTNRGQIEDKLQTTACYFSDSKTKETFSSLVGLQRKITIFIYEHCTKARDKITEPLSLEYIATNCKTTFYSAKKTLQRLEKKHVILRSSFKKGRGGWTKYELPHFIFQDVLFSETKGKSRTNQGQIEDKIETEMGTKSRTNYSSSGGIYNLNTTTTSEPNNSKTLTNEWLNMDIEPLSNIGFTKTHLSQIASQNILSTELVQNSIYAFAFDLQENNKAKNINSDPINYFMGILRKGKPYAPTSNYESPQDKAIRLYKEKMKEIEQRRVAIEKDAINLAFNDWFVQLTDDQKRELLPEMLRRNAKLEKNRILESSARGHFETEVWPDLKKKITWKTDGVEQGGEDNNK